MKNLGSKKIETDRLILKSGTINEQKYLWGLIMKPEINRYYLTIPKKFKDILGIILSKKNGLISDTYTLKKGPGNIKEYNEKEISNEIEIYRKNNSN